MNTTATPAIEFADLTKSYAQTVVLGPVSGAFDRGGITALVGPNGAGKSTLLTILGRLLTPDSGTALLNGRAVASMKPTEIARTLAILRQENGVNARLTVRDLVAFGRFPHSRGRLTTDDVRHIDDALGFLGLTELSDRFLDELSGGQRQRAYVAMTLAQDTEVILLDEPLNNLDMRHQVGMMGQLRRAADELGKTIILVVHDLNFAAAYADRIVALKHGSIAASGTPAEIMDSELLTGIFQTPVAVHSVNGLRVAVYAGMDRR
ncbi:ABC transporter related protein OS=Tsukamurella paurometabola (strain ATCC 8368 / DSM / CCUG 35730 / CIP 100753 / JCM 10117 / KCTC 9821 / NBRC 16120 / NCIMB 702349 / NCTC 13040) OX=521096 GN=Tpau_2666 PE=4 SV=1 [Tsukamurella paurometabola]|uniref:ABC transporter related protein n=1 Tax=Tsukamurella paurometabola (strain ATCC 8368 / DSM 20162 / CCUG 35730 / CIP 100753 / JCM 10117 / KCTC 9821 / NBRC 16120 / NCIMB 702349 / NCTC 13040) TaxID=521096 RepID=D5USJ5_TSUPD|nr:ATP-binding cassette domain-containing protein [Tsukamurella paurometabola]ADG79266.1 ABC transporter related protein [Tsukamurella paurometabola DSM 20162]SUP34836.1 Iron(3+)-hydroxamate import ATP-binding protein FhuC [Tsukamurella paurometabola]